MITMKVILSQAGFGLVRTVKVNFKFNFLYLDFGNQFQLT